MQNNFSYYKCAKSKDFFCGGTAKKFQDGTVVELKPHSILHIRNINDEENMVKIFRDALKLRATNEIIPLKTIYDNESLRYYQYFKFRCLYIFTILLIIK